MSAFAGVDTGVRDLEFKVSEVAVVFARVAESQAGILETIQRVESSLIPTSGDTPMREAPEVTGSDPDSRLPTFLARFDLLEFNSLPASHFYRFGPP